MISLSFGVHTRNWLRIDLQPLKFIFELYFWKFREGGGGGGGGRFAKFQKRLEIIGRNIKLKTRSRSQKVNQSNR